MQQIFQRIEQGYAGKRAGLLYTRYVSRKFAMLFTALFFKLNISPNIVTVLSAVFALSGAGVLFLPVGSVSSAIIMLIFLQVSYALDSADGQLARLLDKPSPIGAWFDLLMDRITGFLVTAALLYWYWEQDMFSGFPQFYGIFVFVMFANLTFSYATNLKGLVIKAKPGPGKSSLLKELVLAPSDTGIFYLILTLTVLITNYLPVLIYSVYKFLLLLTVIGRTLSAPEQMDRTEQSAS
ncbi:MAG: CDP-alcohol phosphatidyltransferase family protein [Firmicutes bacterium]|nr:CDP-alcohol phosphatidyltransferase family protein [Bacillota bacterium]